MVYFYRPLLSSFSINYFCLGHYGHIQRGRAKGGIEGPYIPLGTRKGVKICENIVVRGGGNLVSMKVNFKGVE